ncbi:MAG: hypothetical protein HOC77_02500 [Chloroflexi bacterium]|jgi:hypothetical protein|nr:hypothetical protein [Chloroflexota bacterium]MBT4072494.1 hypothetical protein [Chloroflexota bacterium]MBT4513946.1 hypothetical protein [Chloroflexota bacterium]MBT5320428.1 hypothetical protein [Chloroflexota bacterium]MBT6681646.1 hypothetical protein [Chloroflexota bacterium]
MPPIRHSHSTRRENVWIGDCPRPSCEVTFDVAADAIQSKIMVLTALSDELRPFTSHVHGSYVVYDHGERGGE